MAVQLHDAEAESPLPADFLTDPDDNIDLFLDQLGRDSVEVQGGLSTYQPFSRFGSSRSSSAMCSPRQSSEFLFSESDEDYIMKLTRQMTQCMIHDEYDQHQHSTSIIGSQKPRENGNFNLTPKRVSTDCAWPQNIQLETPNSALTTPMLNHSRRMHIVKQQVPKSKQEFDQGHQYRGIASGGSNYGRSSNRHVDMTPSSAWPPLQHLANSSSGMRVMFLGGSNRTNKSSGTGVFLPPGIVNSSESRKKQGCSTVLIPAKVVQALKFHFDQMGGALSPANSAAGPVQFGASIGQRKRLVPHSNRHPRTTTKMSQLPNHPEMSLPHDWTY